MKTCVIVASVGRPQDVGFLLANLSSQDVPPNLVVLSVESHRDLPEELGESVRVVFGPRGACVQRNRGLDLIGSDFDVVAFFDDDFIPSKRYIKSTIGLFDSHEDIVGATGLVLKDGVTTGGLEISPAMSIVESHDNQPQPSRFVIKNINRAYGCNMVFRASAIRDIRFDENLPMQGWQEDVDFAARVSKNGRVVYTNAIAGVHRGVIGARSSGLRVGYAQIANPIYLIRKRTISPFHAVRIIFCNVVANHLKMLRPEQHVDRLGRAKGNWLAFGDLCVGRCDPMNILNLQ